MQDITFYGEASFIYRSIELAFTAAGRCRGSTEQDDGAQNLLLPYQRWEGCCPPHARLRIPYTHICAIGTKRPRKLTGGPGKF